MPTSTRPPRTPPQAGASAGAGWLPIGRFARATGFSVPTLRHYAAIGLLRPARVAPGTGYRYYHPGQLAAGRAIRALRDLDVPLGAIATLLHAGGDVPPAALPATLRAHRRRLAAEAATLAERLARTDRLIWKGAVPGPMEPTAPAFYKIIPALPSRDVPRAARHYADALGFTLAELKGDAFASVGRGPVAEVNLYLRKAAAPFTPAECYVFVDDPDALHAAYTTTGARIVAPPQDTPWGFRQFTVADLDGHRLHLFRFLDDDD